MIKLLIALFIIGLFFVQKVGTHGSLLNHPYDKIYKVLKKIFDLIHSPLKKNIKPVTIGRGLDLDIIPFITLIILLVIMMLVSREAIYLR